MRETPWIEIIVEGAGQFPFDMLRYDSCFPKGEEDAAAMESHRRERRRVTLCSPSVPTKDRWDSFMWRVIEYKRKDGRFEYVKQAEE